jgi:hypothetical protein
MTVLRFNGHVQVSGSRKLRLSIIVVAQGMIATSLSGVSPTLDFKRFLTRGQTQNAEFGAWSIDTAVHHPVGQVSQSVRKCRRSFHVSAVVYAA